MGSDLTTLDGLGRALASIQTIDDGMAVIDAAKARRDAWLALGGARTEANRYAVVFLQAVAMVGEMLGLDVRPGQRTDLDGTVPGQAQLPRTTKRNYRKVARVPGEVRQTYFDVVGEQDILSMSGLLKYYKSLIKEDRGKAKGAPIEGHHAAELHVSDVAGLIEFVAPESVDFIVTDPPYPKEYLPVYSDLSRTAAHVLKPGGSCLVMVGQSYLPEVIDRMVEHLTYHWTLAYMTPGGQAVQLHQRRVNAFWKPVLWLVKGEYAGHWIGDVAASKANDNDKRFHEWGQSESGMADLIERFCRTSSVILDPFCGGGTTLAVAAKLGHRVIGSDASDKAIETTRSRLGLQA